MKSPYGIPTGLVKTQTSQFDLLSSYFSGWIAALTTPGPATKALRSGPNRQAEDLQEEWTGGVEC